MHTLDISRPLLPQFGAFLGAPANTEGLRFDNALGRGQIERHAPLATGGASLLHFRYRMAAAFPLRSRNPADSAYFLLNVNLSEAPVDKHVGERALSFHRHAPAAVLLYPPGTEVTTAAPPGVDFEVALVRLPAGALAAYYPTLSERLASASATPLYVALDATAETLLRDALTRDGGLLAHARLLEFVAGVFTKVGQRLGDGTDLRLHPADVAGVFRAAALLRDPLTSAVPTVPQLAAVAGMSETKFKAGFRRVFGAAPMRYFRALRMAYALEALRRERISVKEVSHRLGYSHASKFTKAFKRHFGRLPSGV